MNYIIINLESRARVRHLNQTHITYSEPIKLPHNFQPQRILIPRSTNHNLIFTRLKDFRSI